MCTCCKSLLVSLRKVIVKQRVFCSSVFYLFFSCIVHGLFGTSGRVKEWKEGCCRGLTEPLWDQTWEEGAALLSVFEILNPLRLFFLPPSFVSTLLLLFFSSFLLSLSAFASVSPLPQWTNSQQSHEVNNCLDYTDALFSKVHEIRQSALHFCFNE